MGMVVDKASMTGLYGGMTTAKNGKTYLSVLSPGPKVDKVQLECGPVAIPPGVTFGTPVVVALLKAEQKFQDFNGSYSVADNAQIVPANK